MRTQAFKLMLFICTLTLTACSSNPFSDYNEKKALEKNKTQVATADQNQHELTPPPPVESKGTIGGTISYAMDESDRTKLSRALDNPIGKSTTWTNPNSRVSFTVVPIKKVSVNGNPFCREYHATAVKNGNSNESTGTACVSADGNWKPVSG